MGMVLFGIAWFILLLYVDRLERRSHKHVHKLEDILEIGPKRAEKLREKGITNVLDFSKASELTLKEILGLNDEIIKRMKQDANTILQKGTE